MNQAEETRASYDLVVTHPDAIGRDKTTYVEVPVPVPVLFLFLFLFLFL